MGSLCHATLDSLCCPFLAHLLVLAMRNDWRGARIQ
jgi:hypothetical protein